MKRRIATLVFFGMVCAAIRAPAITFTAFGPHGESGAKNNRSVAIGAGGLAHELDAFLIVGGLDLNGTEPGTSASLARHSLPPGLAYQFSPTLSADGTDLILTYVFSNQTTAVFSELRFFVFLDAEIDQGTNTFFNEYGAVTGLAGHGPGDASADTWQIGEPGFRHGTIIQNLLLGSLGDSNAIPSSLPDDVALALGFQLGSLSPGESISVRVMISEDGDSRGSLALLHRDLAPASGTVITLSGEADINQAVVDVTPLVQMNFRWGFDPATGHLHGTLLLLNPPGSTAVLGAPFRLGLQNNPDFVYVRPTGVFDNGVPYLDLTGAVFPQLGADRELTSGELVVAGNIEIQSPDRSLPPNNLFSLSTARVR